MCEFYLTNKNCQNDKSAFTVYCVKTAIFSLRLCIIAMVFHNNCEQKYHDNHENNSL